MFKRSLVAVTVVAVVSGTVVAPANAMTVTVNKDMTCTIKQTDEEASYTRLDPTVKATKEIATRLKADYVEGFLSTIRPEIEKLKQKLADPDLAEAMKKDLAGQLEKKEKSFTAMKNFSNALDACIDGRDYDSSKPEGPSNPGPSKPEGPSNPGPSKPEGPSNPGPSKPEGPSNPGPSKPEGPSNPGPSKPEGPSNPGPSKPEGRVTPSANALCLRPTEQ
ncbi:hypothetical protein FRC0191_01958 [Corynebacterium diphtheriae]|nr:hypothetical protein FRC0191_01958 [Corynebacterium diphtheriae]